MARLLALVGVLSLLCGGAFGQPINQLPSGTIPLAGTETVPIWQGSTVKTTVQSIANLGGGVSVLGYGAKCDGTTDDTTAITNALAANVAVTVPAKTCVSTTGITVPPNHKLAGTIFNPGNPVASASSAIECPANIGTACVTLGDGTTNAPVILSDITVLGSGSVSATSTGVHINAGYNVVLQNVNVRNFGYLYHWQSYASAGAGISGSMINTYGSQADTAYVWYDAWPELHISVARFGANGAGDYNALADFVISGGVAATAGGPNGLTIENSQFNQGGGAGPQYAFYFRNLGSGGVPGIDADEVKVTDSHFEGQTTAFMGSDSSWNEIDRFFMVDNEVNIPTLPCLALNAATNVEDWQLTGNLLYCSTFTLNPSASAVNISFLKITGNNFGGTFTLTAPSTGSTAWIGGNTFSGAATFSGQYGALSVVGNTYLVSGTFNQTGTFVVSEPQYPAQSTYAGLASANVFTAAQSIGTNTTAQALEINGPAGGSRFIQYQTAGVPRWVTLANATAESGGNVGTDFGIDRYSDAGSLIDHPLIITRSTGRANFADGLSVVGSTTAQTALNIGTSGSGTGTLLCSATAPTITSAGTLSTVLDANGTCSFTINVGGGGTASAIVLALPTATTGWTCGGSDLTTQSTSVFLQKQTASGTASATVTNFNTAGSATPFAANDHVRLSCYGD